MMKCSLTDKTLQLVALQQMHRQSNKRDGTSQLALLLLFCWQLKRKKRRRRRKMMMMSAEKKKVTESLRKTYQNQICVLVKQRVWCL